MSDQSTSSKNDQEKPTTSDVKSPEPKSVVRVLRAPKSKEKSEIPGSSSTKSPKPKSVVRVLRAPGSKFNDESMDEEELKDFMKKGGYLIASSGSEEEDEPLMFRAMKRSKRHQLEYMRAVEDLRRKKSGVSVERNEDREGNVDPGIPHVEVPEIVERFLVGKGKGPVVWERVNYNSYFWGPGHSDADNTEDELSCATGAEDARRKGNPPTSFEANFARYLDRQISGPVDPEENFEAWMRRSEDEQNMKKPSSEE